SICGDLTKRLFSRLKLASPKPDPPSPYLAANGSPLTEPWLHWFVPVPSPEPVALFFLPVYNAFGLTVGLLTCFSGVAVGVVLGLSVFVTTAGASSMSCVTIALSLDC